MKNIELTESEEKIKKEISDFLKKAEENKYHYKDIDKDIDKFGAKAHELHMSLKKHGYPPKHFQYMIENRGMKPDNVDFYKHIYPMQDLLRFIDDRNSIKDPVDKTMNKDFRFKVYSKRWGHEDTYTITRVKEGWKIQHISINGISNREGEPFLFKNLEQDSISYPSTLGSLLEQLWKLGENGISENEMQAKLNEISNWVIETEKNEPIFNL